MKLIIEIPEDVYNDMVKLVKVDGDIDRLVDVAIVNGTPLTESDDCVSRAELLKALDTWDKFGVDDTGHLFRLDNLSYPHYEPYIHYRDVIKAVKGMPSVQPNREKHDEEIIKKTVESIWGKPPYTEVLDAIRAEIEQYKADCDLTCSDDSNCRTCNNITFGTIYQIIDKYRKGQTDADSD